MHYFGLVSRQERQRFVTENKVAKVSTIAYGNSEILLQMGT